MKMMIRRSSSQSRVASPSLSSRAHVVHLEIHGTVIDKVGAASWNETYDTNARALLDVFYDPSLPIVSDDPFVPYRVFGAEDSDTNYWRLRFGHVDVGGSLERLALTDTSLAFRFWDDETKSGLDMGLRFVDDPSPSFRLPVPPFPALASLDPEMPMAPYLSTFTFNTLNGWDLEAGSICVGIDELHTHALSGSDLFDLRGENWSRAQGSDLRASALVKAVQRRRTA